ncbi:MAG TPA: type II CAAX endopeptidase family protein [Vicinamibacterales bacterium]|jgi:membrane protease YdiL (CAAX protease family)
MARVAAAFEVLLCSGLPTQIAIIALLGSAGVHPRTAGGTLSPRFIFSLTLLDTVLVVSLVALFLRSSGESWRAQLFASPSPRRDVLLGIALVPASFAIVAIVLTIVQVVAPSLRNVPHNPMADLVRTRLQAVAFAFVVTIAGGVREEIQRGFVLRRFEQYLGGGTVGLVAFSLLFGLGHLEQGRDVALATSVLGAFWGAIFLRRRSILGPMIGHAGFDLAQIANFLTMT